MPTTKTPQQLAQAIVDSGIKPNDLADKISVDKSTVSRILAGTITDPKYSTVKALIALHDKLAKRPRGVTAK